MALKLGNPDSEIIDIVFQTKVDLEGTEQLAKSLEGIYKLVEKAHKRTQATEKEILHDATKIAKSLYKDKQEELQLIQKLTKAYIDYRRALQQGWKVPIGRTRNILVDTLAQYSKLKKGAENAAVDLVRIFSAADRQIALDIKHNTELRQKILDHYYDKEIARQAELKKAAKERYDYYLDQVYKFEKEKEKFQEQQDRKRQQQFAVELKKEMEARQKASQMYFEAKRKEMQFDLKAHNHRLAYLEAEANKQKVLQSKWFGLAQTPKQMAWGRTPEEAKRMMAAQRQLHPSHSQYIGEYAGIHSTDLRTFRHKLYTTAQYSTAAMMYYGVVQSIRSAIKATMDFNKYMSQMAAVFRITNTEATQLGYKLQHLGETLGGSQEEIYKIALSLGRAGVATKDLAKASEVVIRMAYLTGDSFNEATNAIITYSEVFGKGTGKGIGYSIQELGDKLAYVANVSRLSTQDIGIFSNYALGAAHAAGLTVDAVGAMAAAFSNAGMNASTIGTQIRRFTTLLSDHTTNVTRFFQSIGVSQSILRNELLASLDGTQEGINRSNEALKRFASRLAALSDNEFAEFTAGMDLLARNSLTFLRQEANAFTTYLEGSLNKANGLLAESDKMINSYIITWEKLFNVIQNGFAKLGESEYVARFFRGLADLTDVLATSVSPEYKKFLEHGYGRDYENYMKVQIAIREAAEQAKYGDTQAERVAAEGRLERLRAELQIWKEIVEQRRKLIQQEEEQARPEKLMGRIHWLLYAMDKPKLLARQDMTRQDAEQELAILGQKLNIYLRLQKVQDESAKQNKEALQIQKEFRKETEEYTKLLARTAYLENIKMESWATMVSQLSKNMPEAFSVYRNMLNYAEQKINRIKTEAQAAVTTTAGIIGADKTSTTYQEMTRAKDIVSRVNSLKSAASAMAKLSVLQVNAEKKINELKAQGVKESDKQIQDLRTTVKFYKDMIGLLDQIQQILTQTKKATNAIWRGTDKDLETVAEGIRSIQNANVVARNKLARLNDVDSQMLKAQDYLYTLDQIIKKLEEQKKANEGNEKVLNAINARLREAKADQTIINQAIRERGKLLTELKDQQAEDQTQDILLKGRKELENIQKRIEGNAVAQDKYINLLVVANKLEREGYKDKAEKVRAMHDELVAASKIEGFMKRRQKYDALAKQNEKYAAFVETYNYWQQKLFAQWEEDYEQDYISYEEMMEKKKAFNEQYAEDLRILNNETLDIFKKQVESQSAYVRQITDAMKDSFSKFFDFTEEGFLDLGDLAKQVMHDIYMQIVEQTVTNPLSQFLGGITGNFIGNMTTGSGGTMNTEDWGMSLGALNFLSTPSAHGNVFQQITKYAKGGVVTRPTVFPMANGTGLMGEAGPEAILPLTRVNGDLGVKAVGGPVVINVENETGLPIDFKQVGEQMQDDGTRIIQVVMEHAQTNPEFRQIMGINT